MATKRERAQFDAEIGMVGRRSSAAHRPGYTMLEVLISTSVGALLLTALASSLFVGTKTAGIAAGNQPMLQAMVNLERLADDLRQANRIVECGNGKLAFFRQDFTGDGVPDSVRYELDSNILYRITTSGRQKFGSDISAISFSNQSSIESIPVPVPSSRSFTQLYEYEPSSDSLTTVSVLSSSTQCFSFSGANLANGTNPKSTNWTLSKISLRLKRANSSGVLTVRVYLADSSGIPVGKALGSATKAASALSSTYDWHDFTFATPLNGLSLSQRYAITVDHSINSAVDIESSTDRNRIEIPASTSEPVSIAGLARFRVFGQVMNESAVGTYNVRRCQQISMTIQPVSGIRHIVAKQVQFFPGVYYHSSFWETNFDSSPITQDLNADGVNDFRTIASSVSVAGGQWTTLTDIHTTATAPYTDSMRVRVRKSTANFSGRICQTTLAMKFGTSEIQFQAHLEREANLGQKLLIKKIVNGTSVDVTQYAGLGTGMIEVEMFVDATNHLLMTRVGKSAPRFIDFRGDTATTATANANYGCRLGSPNFGGIYDSFSLESVSAGYATGVLQ